MLELTLRLVCSLAVVVGLLLVLAKIGQRRFRGNTNALVQVVHRQALSRTSSVAVVTVGSRVLVLGTTEQQIRVLAELDPEELLDHEAALALTEEPPRVSDSTSVPTPAAAPAVTPTAVPEPLGPVAGSVLSPATWRQALAAISSVTARRPS
ncbi:flagellar biosynthetic protein FliO [Nocardioides houyundeii]|uniref:flagellar biosynthetic protein FliO n=1 Tax=Nocardioides houyundeii TaxID=2045452 RepID=UPI000DF3B0B0|nr:flagellar biosynthetic protein FliO [Nocardioides houyundeii]